jgi:Tfp pilus assembly major pilin PilA
MSSTQDTEALYRATVGAKKANFYVPKFIRFDQPGVSKLSWNWPAFFVSFYWFLYRRMYVSWAIFSLLIPIAIGVVGTIFAAVGSSIADLLYLVMSIGYYFGVIPLFANSLYHREVKERIGSLRQKVPETSAQLLVLDNTSPTNNIVWIIIVIVMIAMLGILAAIAIPAYQDYTIRAQVNEGVLLARQIELEVVKKYASTESWAVSIEDLNISQPLSARYVTALVVDHGTVSVTYGNQANPLLVGKVLSFRPSVTGIRTITWACGYAAQRENPDNDTGPNLTDVKPLFLPRDCR